MDLIISVGSRNKHHWKITYSQFHAHGGTAETNVCWPCMFKRSSGGVSTRRGAEILKAALQSPPPFSPNSCLPWWWFGISWILTGPVDSEASCKILSEFCPAWSRIAIFLYHVITRPVGSSRFCCRALWWRATSPAPASFPMEHYACWDIWCAYSRRQREDISFIYAK